jgi:hypothetical protein
VIVIALVIGVVALVGYVIAHIRPAPPPSAFVAEVGPLFRKYGAPASHMTELLARSASMCPGMQVVHCAEDQVLLNVRPNVTRLDDGFGLFVRFSVEPTPDGQHAGVLAEGQRKFVLDWHAERALVSIERQIRLSLKRHCAVSVLA